MILFFPSEVIACSASVCALSGVQSGVSYSLPIVTLPSSTECAPFLNCAAFGSVGGPLIITIGPRFGQLAARPERLELRREVRVVEGLVAGRLRLREQQADGAALRAAASAA